MTVPLERVQERLWPRGNDAYSWALLDGARDRRVQPAVQSSGLAYRCLYTGDLPPELARVAPWLVRLSRDAPLTRELVEDAWGHSWGVFLRAPVGLDALHRHLRRLLRVKTEQGRTMLFRYYDPRVLRVFLPTCTAAEVEQVFGPVASFVLEGDAPEQMLTFRRGAHGLTCDEARFEARLPWLKDYLRKGLGDTPPKP